MIGVDAEAAGKHNTTLRLQLAKCTKAELGKALAGEASWRAYNAAFKKAECRSGGRTHVMDLGR